MKKEKTVEESKIVWTKTTTLLQMKRSAKEEEEVVFAQIEGGNLELQGADQKTLIWSVLFGNHLNDSIKVPNICKESIFFMHYYIY